MDDGSEVLVNGPWDKDGGERMLGRGLWLGVRGCWRADNGLRIVDLG